MLSIAKLAAGGQRYYLDQAKARVDHQRSVASGVEDYYLGGPEATGRWLGSVAERGGYGGQRVTEDGLHWALSWASPVSGAELEGPVRHARVPGFDLMFSVPKSASVLFGIGPPRVQRAVREAQQVAVREAMRYLEKTAARTRMGRGGHAVVEGRGLLGAAFEHRTSRAGDPSCTLTSWWPTRSSAPMGSSARSTDAPSTRSRGPPASSTRRRFGGR